MSLPYTMLKGITRFGSWAPLRASRAAGCALGAVLRALDRRHREVVAENLAASFPRKSQVWVKKTSNAVYAHLGQVITEIPSLVHWPEEKFRERIRTHGLENVAEAAAKGKGLIYLTGHIGNWEWFNLANSLLSGPVMVVARPLDYAPADRLINEWRSRFGSIIVPMKGSARSILGHLRQGGRVGVLLDQGVDWYEGVWVDFFGRPACTNTGPALLALKTGAAVVPYYCHRSADGHFDIYAEPEVPLVRTGDKTRDVWQNTQNYTAVLERIIRQKPEQWFWLHRRWKRKPYCPWPKRQD